MKITQELYNKIQAELVLIENKNYDLNKTLEKRLEVYKKYGIDTEVTEKNKKIFDEYYSNYFAICSK